MSTLIDFRQDDNNGAIGTVVPVGGDNQNMGKPLSLSNQGTCFIRTLGVLLNAQIPNIFTYQAFDNRVVKVRINGMALWSPITLRAGRYSVTEIADAINAQINTWLWWLNPANPGLEMGINAATGATWILIDDSKLNIGCLNFQIDLSRNVAGSDLGYTLGFQDVDFLGGMGNGTHYNSTTPRVDSQGVYAQILCSLYPERRINEKLERIVATIPIDQTNSLTTIQWPAGGILAPSLWYDGPRQVSTYRVWTQSGRAEEERTKNFPLLVLPLGLSCYIEMELHS